MTHDLSIRRQGCLGRITLTRVKHLNALTQAMVSDIRTAIAGWQTDPAIRLIVIDAEGERAFCAGGDILALYQRAQEGDIDTARAFWATEYRMNLEIGASEKPVVTFLHGFVMGGGIGLGCHAAHRFCDPETVFAVSQAKIGLAPDAGASFLLALAPGRMGEYLATTGDRFHGADALWLGFADALYPRGQQADLIALLAETGDLAALPPPLAPNTPPALALLTEVNTHFAGQTLADIWLSLKTSETPFAQATKAKMLENSPLAMSAAVEMLHRIGDGWPLIRALDLEYRYAHRALVQGDLAPGIRARLIDRGTPPLWRHSAPDRVPGVDFAAMLAPLGPAAWSAHD